MRGRPFWLLIGVFALSVAAAPVAGQAGAPGDVLVIGDSLGVGTEPYLEQELSTTAIRTDAKTSRTSAAGLELLAANAAPGDDALVFALGTNDDPASPEALAANLAEAAAIAGDRCLVVATVARPPLNGVSDAGLNRAIESFAAANANVRLVDWRAAVAADPALLTDGVHATPEGYALRAALFADALRSCGSAAVSGGGDGIPNPDPDVLREGRTRPPAERPRPAQEPISRDEALKILVDATASQIAIGALP